MTTALSNIIYPLDFLPL